MSYSALLTVLNLRTSTFVKQASSLRFQKVVRNVSIDSTIRFNDGKVGSVVEKKGSWYSIKVVGAQGVEKIVKARKSEFNTHNGLSTEESTSALQVKKSMSRNKTLKNPVVIPKSEIAVPLKLDNTLNITDELLPDVVPASLTTTAVPALHSTFNKWVIFSDLHVKGSSIEACEEVLDEVHKAAVENNAGIIFLGDFWHVRGSLSVELLNRVLLALRKWQQPVIMIPGNHDQVTLGGAVHALTPLLYAFRPEQILMIDEPTVCMGALWIPYRRDSTLMRSILAAGATHPEVSMIFCHADVRGAMMNDGMRSREGLDISSFPENLPIYSGHFHKPHTMTKNHSTLRYVGSPYQTSLSEAGQDKFLYCMSCDPDSTSKVIWKEDRRWTIDIGKKYFKAESITDVSVENARPGDRVVVPVRVGEDYEAEALSSTLRARGVEVELRHEKNVLPSVSVGDSASLAVGDGVNSSGSAETSLTDVGAEDADPVRVFSEYMGNVDTSAVSTDVAGMSGKDFSDVAKLALHSAVLTEGKSTIERLMGSEALAGNELGDSVKSNRMYNLKLDHLCLQNFGPYGGAPVQYPLSSRGLVLIRGQSTDGTGADSNGSGKTTLAMSVMWALTGSLDARLVADGRSADVAYDSGAYLGKDGLTKKKSKDKLTAEVALSGSINDKNFELIRRRGKKSELLFTLDGRDLTTQSVADTQKVVDSELGIGNGLLQRCCFFGQHSHTLQSLLGLTDVKLKNELSALVSTDIWAAALQDVKAREKLDKIRTTELGVETRMRTDELDRLRKAITQDQGAIALLEDKLIVAEKKATNDAGVDSADSIAHNADSGELVALTEKLTSLRGSIESNLQSVIEPLRKEVLNSSQDKSTQLAALDQPINQLKLRKATVESLCSTSNASIKQLNARLSKLVSQDSAVSASVTPLLNTVNESFPAIPSTVASYVHDLVSGNQVLSTEQVDSAALRKSHENAFGLLTRTDVSLKSLNKSLSNILELNTSLSTKAGVACSTHGQDQCPTCGQTMPEGSRESREAELRATIGQLQADKAILTKISDQFRKKYDASQKLRSALDQQKPLKEQIVSVKAELSSAESALVTISAELIELDSSIKKKLSEKSALESELLRIHAEKTKQLAELERDTKRMQEDERQLRTKIDELRKAEAVAIASRGIMNAEMLTIHNKIASAKASLTEKTSQMTSIEGSIAQVESDKKTITERAAVLERLMSVLGPRGIQNYVFQGVLRQIEGIANAYLTVLADGGIQLTLQGEEDADKIIKSVTIRAADGIFKERGLSQLSGGQWRRVSMALDLAFAEVIRRRGILRSNLIVMDEVLTHLDASGREAVGTVLRAMVEGPRAEDDPVTTDASGARFSTTSQLSGMLLGGGAYETVIVILQDLAAVELEEAFDCVDVVVKEADTARVVVDDGH